MFNLMQNGKGVAIEEMTYDWIDENIDQLYQNLQNHSKSTTKALESCKQNFRKSVTVHLKSLDKNAREKYEYAAYLKTFAREKIFKIR